LRHLPRPDLAILPRRSAAVARPARDADRSRRLALAGGALLVLSLSSLGLLVVARAGGRQRAWS
jgi:hypothetical protein